jgi:histidinol-phosphatase (PHP family)
MCVEADAVFALSSDAHAPDYVGYEYGRAVDLLRELRVDELCVFENRERRMEALG